jgi:hypothetical protein
VHDEYQQYYKLSFKTDFPKDMSSNFKQYKKSFQTDFGQSDLELIHVPHGDADSIRTTFTDPLAAAVYIIFNYIDQVKKDSYPHLYLAERHAYLYEFVPQKTRDYLYPELEAYTQDLIDRAASTPIVQTARKLHTFLTFEEHHTVGKLRTLRDPQAFSADEAPYFIPMAVSALKIREVEAAKSGLNTLIARGYYVTEANLLLARIHYQQKNYPQAVTHYKHAQNKAGLFSNKDQKDFSQAVKFAGKNLPTP